MKDAPDIKMISSDVVTALLDNATQKHYDDGDYRTASLDIVESMSMDMVFDFMGISLGSGNVQGKSGTVQWNFTDTDQHYTLFLENSVLNYWPESTHSDPDTTVTLTRGALNKLFAKQTSLEELAKTGEITVVGDPQKLS